LQPAPGWRKHLPAREPGHVNSPEFSIEHVLQGGARLGGIVPNGADASISTRPTGAGIFGPGTAWKTDLWLSMQALTACPIDLKSCLDRRQDIENQRTSSLCGGRCKEKKNLQAHASQMKLTNLVFLPPVRKVKWRSPWPQRMPYCHS